MNEPIRFRQDYFPAAIDIIAWCMQNPSSIHRLRKKLEPTQGFDIVGPCRHGACVVRTLSSYARSLQFRHAHGLSGTPWAIQNACAFYARHGFRNTTVELYNYFIMVHLRRHGAYVVRALRSCVRPWTFGHAENRSAFSGQFRMTVSY